MSETEEKKLVRLCTYRFFRGMIIEDISKIISKSYLKDRYCLKIIDILQNAMIEVSKTSLVDADKHFLEEMEKLKG